VPRRERADRGTRPGDGHVSRVEAAARPPAGTATGTRYQRVSLWRAGDSELDALQGVELDAHLSGRSSAGTLRHPPANFLAQRSSHVDIDSGLIIDPATQNVKGAVLNQLDLISKTTKADIFLLMPKQPDIESASFNGNIDTGMDPRLRCAIFGDLETMEHAKTRVLIMIDQIVSSSHPPQPSSLAHKLI
jgi:hypothetical protein